MMFKYLQRLSLKVNDLSAASEWYGNILKSSPLYSTPLIVIYKVNDSELVLLPSDSTVNYETSSVVYWEVEDADETVKMLKAAGATVKEEARTVLDSRWAKVTDPFGFTFGLISKISTKQQSLKDRPSESAMTTLFCRAVSAADEREEIKGPDYLAQIFLPEESKTPLRDKGAREWVLKNILTGGAYEYFIARTAYVDELFISALYENIPQVIFLGAGYDSRPYRFHDHIKDTKIYELDSPFTQERKLKLLRSSDAKIHPNITFIPIDFDTESLQDKLLTAGFNKNDRTLYIWEGVTYYLDPDSVYGTLRFIRNFSLPGSILFFDYMLYSSERHNRPEIREALERMKKNYKAESVKFNVNEGCIEEILREYGFRVIEEMTTEKMEQKYLRLKDGTLSGRIIDLFSFVKAEVMQ